MSQSPVNADVYYKDLYWNDHQLTLDYLCRLISAGWCEKPLWWPSHFKKRYLAGGPVERALFINCGNGWAERELFELGLFLKADAFDYSENLLDQARKAAKGMPINYFWADCNKIELAIENYDLVVNVAAMHHVQYINRLNRQIAACLKPAGYFLNFDYIGPHRNQYSPKHFAAMSCINSRLPRNFRKDPLTPAHLPTMLATDPTEAIHSELTISCFERYFYTVERKDLNGSIAYQIMHNNSALVNVQSPDSLKCVNSLLEVDELFSSDSDCPSLFSFYVGKPRKKVLLDDNLMEQFSLEEEQRENLANSNGGLYYNCTLPRQ